jgi:DeoR/GlpR family transcriptional regulator of sugar metabolism
MTQKSVIAKRARILRIIDEVNRVGRVTPGRVVKMFDVTYDTASRYLANAEASSDAIRFGRCGLFRDNGAIADFKRERLEREKQLRKQKSITKTLSTINTIFQECRQSGAMQRVLSVYGVRV